MLYCAMRFMVMMHGCRPGELLARAAFKHHSDPMGLIHSGIVGMMHGCKSDKFLTRAVFMHHDDKGHSTLEQYAALKGST